MSPRPGRIAAVIAVDLPRPRSLATLAMPGFQAHTQTIRELIYGDKLRATVDRPTL